MMTIRACVLERLSDLKGRSTKGVHFTKVVRTTPSIDEVMAASILQDFAPIAESNANPNGYWGAITSSVNWCEINYHVSSYLCEFFNSFSSVAMVLVGVLGYFLQHDLLERAL